MNNDDDRWPFFDDEPPARPELRWDPMAWDDDGATRVRDHGDGVDRVPGEPGRFIWDEPLPRPADDRSGPIIAVVGLSIAIVASVFLGIYVFFLSSRESATVARPDASLARYAQPNLPPGTSAIVQAVDQGVVNITTILGNHGGEAAGTGIVLTPDGRVLTNHHVIEGATSISVEDIGNGKTYSATVVGSDVDHDIAVLQMQSASGLKVAPLGDSSKVKVGDAVIALGNARGAGGTPSIATGSVTALDQAITATDQSGRNAEDLEGLFQMDAVLQPGDSGGPLVSNATGKVIGIDTAASVRRRGRRVNAAGNESFAIPINDALAIVKQIETSH